MLIVLQCESFVASELHPFSGFHFSMWYIWYDVKSDGIAFLLTDYGGSAGSGAVILDDCNFHESVHLDSFDVDRTLTLVRDVRENMPFLYLLCFCDISLERLFPCDLMQIILLY